MYWYFIHTIATGGLHTQANSSGRQKGSAKSDLKTVMLHFHTIWENGCIFFFDPSTILENYYTDPLWTDGTCVVSLILLTLATHMIYWSKV